MSQSFSEQKEKLMQELPCTPAFAEGYLDGKVCRTHGRELSRSFRFGLDEYAAGFRTGYYVQVCSVSIKSKRETAVTS
jgi:hypothetical protein